MGYIKLFTDVSHVWYLKGTPSYFAILLKKKLKSIETILYYTALEDEESRPIESNLNKSSFGKEENYELLIETYLNRRRPKEGAEVIKENLKKINLKQELAKSRNELSADNSALLIKRIRILESFLSTNAKPTWMILSILPVLPPGLRPMIQLESGRFATSDLNDLYRKVITRNNRLMRLYEIYAPDLVIRNEKRLLQEGVDTLIDNGRRGEKILDSNKKPFKSLSDVIEGKQGRFRQNLLGKRVDYSGRSVITVGPNLKLSQCGLPYEMAIELFKPFLMRELVKEENVGTIAIARKIITENNKLVEKLLHQILKCHPVLLNRAPTLHRFGIQAFEPILVKGKAILLHPLVCPPFNADFDGDQMAVHIPLSVEAQSEAISLLYAPGNFLSPAVACDPIITPSQDILLGCYYLTTENLPNLLGSNHYFSNLKHAILAYENNKINLHAFIWVRFNGYLQDSNNPCEKILTLNNGYKIYLYKNKQIRQDKHGKIIVTYIRTTVGRIIFNNVLNNALLLNF